MSRGGHYSVGVARLGILFQVALLSLGIISIPASAGGNEWSSNGPDGGFVFCLAIDPVTPTTVYAGTRGEGVYKSINGGASWFAENNGLPKIPGQIVSSILIDQGDPDILYASARIWEDGWQPYGGGIYKSTNAGATWHAIDQGLPQDITFIAMDPHNPLTLYATTIFQVFRSTDGGSTWTALNGGSPLFGGGDAITQIVIDPTISTTLYVSTYGNGILKSIDGGATWKPINNGIPQDSSGFSWVATIAIDPLSSSTLLAGMGSRGGIAKSTDGGHTWTIIPLDYNDFIQSIAYASSDSEIVYAIGSATIHRSADGGNTWTGLVPCSSPPQGCTWCPNYYWGGWIAIDPTNDSTVYATWQNGVGITKTTDGGTTWESIDNGLNNVEISSLAVVPGAPAVVYAGAIRSWGASMSTDGGIAWTRVNVGLQYAAPCPDDSMLVMALVTDPANRSILYAGTGYAGVYKTTDGGVTWSQSGLTNTSVVSLLVDPASAQTIYAGTIGGGIYKSTDGGVTWSQVNSGLTNLTIWALAMTPSSPSVVYAGSEGGGIFKSTDGGSNWIALNNGLTGMIVLALAIDQNVNTTLYAGTWTAGVFKSTDGGNTWVESNSGLSSTDVRAIVIDPAKNSNLYVGTYGGGVFESVDGGGHWNEMNAGLANRWVFALALDASSPPTLYAGSDFGSVSAFTACPNPTILPPSLSNGQVGLAYSKTMTLCGGAQPATFAITSGTLPSGLNLFSDGTLSGTPTASGTFEFSVTATDANGEHSNKAFALQILPVPPAITNVQVGQQPFRLIVKGSNFHPSAQVQLNATSAPSTTFKSPTKLVAKGGASLKMMVPRGVPISVTVKNGDDGGTSSAFMLTRQ